VKNSTVHGKQYSTTPRLQRQNKTVVKRKEAAATTISTTR